MESKTVSDSKLSSKLIKCKNCRQEILASKMFLHEGFCVRNNKFCEHCGKVLLKKDYESHFNLNLGKKNKNSKEKFNKKLSEINEIKGINIYRSPIITKRNPAFEYIQMPMTEEYKINKPIIISENGQIISNKNKNEFLLPFFGINSCPQKSNNETKKRLDAEFILNQTELFKENYPPFNKNFNFDINIEKNMKNSVSMGNLNSNHNLYDNSGNYKQIRTIKQQIEQDNDNFLNLNVDENINNDINLLKSPSSPLINNISFIKENHGYEDKINNDNNDLNNNNIIINNNIITYNSNNNIKKIHNIYSAKDKLKDRKTYIVKKEKDFLLDVPRDKNNTNFNPLRISNKEEIEKFQKKVKSNLLKNNSKTNLKEPNDSKSKDICGSFLLEKKPQNRASKKKIKTKPQSIEGKKYKKDQNKCEFCNSNVEDLVTHYKYYHLKKNNDFIKPKKRDTALLNEKLNSESIDEGCIDENKKKILLRELKPNLHVESIDRKNKDKSQKKNSTEKKFKKPEKIEKITFNKIFNNEVKYVKKNFPEDSKRNKNLIRNQKRFNKYKDLLNLNDEYNIRIDDNYSKNNFFKMSNSPEIRHTNISGDLFNPLFFFTDAKKHNNNISDGIINSSKDNYMDYFGIQRNSFDVNNIYKLSFV